MLESYIRERRKEREILLMTHIVLGYPSFDDSMRVVERMVESGVDLMELQIPFSEPMADGPVILKANAAALELGATVEQCMGFAAEVTRRFDIPFLFMTYYNIVCRYGVHRFAQAMAERNIRGAIVPDLPPEEADEYMVACAENGLEPIFLYAPTTTNERMAYLNGFSKGMVYCAARKGVTGADTEFSESIDSYLKRCAAATSLPLAVGFGVKDRRDVDYLKGKADIAIVGSATIRLLEEQGPEAVGPFIRSLRIGG